MHSLSFTINELTDDELPTIAELSGDLHHMAEIMAPVVGDERLTVRAVLAVAFSYCGGGVHFLGVGEITRKIRNRRIRAEYDHGVISGPQLARKYRLSDRHIWTILGGPES